MSRSTFSKHPLIFPERYPAVIDGGRGAYLYLPGSVYLDWAQGLGAAGIFGHNWIFKFLHSCVASHLPSPLESEVADLMCSMLPPYAEEVRFCLNGTDATAAAIRLARALTGRMLVIAFKGAYHGESGVDWMICAKPPARGVPDFVPRPMLLPWNDADVLARSPLRAAAAVIFEVMDDPTPKFVAALNTVRDRGCLLIADEVVTGFRLARDGACGFYGIKPDLACFGKALGSGVPIAALVGRKELMREFDLEWTNEPVFMSYTHAGNPLGLTAAKATLDAINNTPSIFETIRTVGIELQRDFLKCAYGENLEHIAYLTGQPARHSFKFRDSEGVLGLEAFWIFQQRLCEQKVLIHKTNFPTVAHDAETLKKTHEAMRIAMASVARAVKKGTIEEELIGRRPTELYVRKQMACAT